MYASHRGNENCTWLFLRSGADVNILGLNGETAWPKNSVTMENLADVKEQILMQMISRKQKGEVFIL